MAYFKTAMADSSEFCNDGSPLQPLLTTSCRADI